MKEQGFTIFIAMIVMGTLLLISSSIVNLAVKQSFISSSGRESQYAFYAADTGIECALFWDVKNPATEITAFSRAGTSEINCNYSLPQVVGGPVATSTFWIFFTPDPYCAKVNVSKAVSGATLIESFGYNTCDTSNPRRVERAVRVSY